MTRETPPSAAVALRNLRRRAGLSMRALAVELGYRNAGGYQRYESAAQFDKPHLPLSLVQRLVEVLPGRGDPPIGADEVWALAGPLPGLLEAGAPFNAEEDHLSSERTGLGLMRLRINQVVTTAQFLEIIRILEGEDTDRAALDTVHDTGT